MICFQRAHKICTQSHSVPAYASLRTSLAANVLDNVQRILEELRWRMEIFPKFGGKIAAYYWPFPLTHTVKNFELKPIQPLPVNV